MSEPIDILEIAARRYHAARAALDATNWAQHSERATVAAERARAALNLAERDLHAAHQMAAWIGTHQEPGLASASG